MNEEVKIVLLSHKDRKRRRHWKKDLMGASQFLTEKHKFRLRKLHIDSSGKDGVVVDGKGRAIVFTERMIAPMKRIEDCFNWYCYRQNVDKDFCDELMRRINLSPDEFIGKKVIFVTYGVAHATELMIGSFCRKNNICYLIFDDFEYMKEFYDSRSPQAKIMRQYAIEVNHEQFEADAFEKTGNFIRRKYHYGYARSCFLFGAFLSAAAAMFAVEHNE